jgi:putative inorganic carbon (hco3(-)) transporter
MRTPTDAAPPVSMLGGAAREAAWLARLSPAVWRVQIAGLLAFVVMTFVPAWSHIQEYAFFGLLALAVATAYAEGRPLAFASPLHVPIALLLGWVLLSVPFAVDPAYSLSEWRKLAAKVLLFYWAVAVWRMALSYGRTRMNGLLLAAVAIGSLAVSLYAVPDFWQRGGTWADRPVRAQAPWSDYNWLSTYMLMALPLLLAGALTARAGRARYACAAGALLALLAQVLSYTSAGWLGLLAQGLAAGLLLKRSRLVAAAGIGILVIAALLFTAGSFGYHQDTLDLWTLKARVAVWGLMLQEIADHPLLGIGYGTETFMARLGGHPETLKAGGSHNFFLMVAMGSGLPALAFLIWVLVAGTKECLRLSQRLRDDPFTSALLLAVALMIIGFAVRNGFDAMFAGSLACLFWLLLAAAVAQDPAAARSDTGRAA